MRAYAQPMQRSISQQHTYVSRNSRYYRWCDPTVDFERLIPRWIIIVILICCAETPSIYREGHLCISSILDCECCMHVKIKDTI
jgi:hypothetical protein